MSSTTGWMLALLGGEVGIAAYNAFKPTPDLLPPPETPVLPKEETVNPEDTIKENLSRQRRIKRQQESAFQIDSKPTEDDDDETSSDVNKPKKVKLLGD